MSKGAPKKIEVRIRIKRPVEDVYNCVINGEDWPKWRNDVVGGELLTEGPLRSEARRAGTG